MPSKFPTPPNLGRPGASTRSLSIKVRPDPLQGRIVLSRYRVNARLARGGMSSVYLTRDMQSGKLYAMKVLRQDLVLRPRARTRFLNECKAIQRIDHPNVVRIFDIGEMDDGRICLVMEYVPGAALRKLLKDGAMPLVDVISIIRDVTAGLAAAHDQCIIHRDLKPENVLIPPRAARQREGAPNVKIVDFGIARILDAPRITTTQHVMGTPQYIAPEQAMGRHLDHRADIYALGVMAYEMLTGELPFSSDDPDFLLRQHVSMPPPPLSKHAIREPIPEDLQYFVMRCLSKSPQNRPADMAEVSMLLARL
ncbi:MAG: serine/threonine-protein kinase [Myxococcota bacterium]|nr:serine/threonine-protein kinase [Myxococcota bacterium]